MQQIRGFIPMAVAFLMFVLVAVPFLIRENSRNDLIYLTSNTNVTAAQYNQTADIRKVDGSTVIGMINNAKNGEYELVVDGIVINQNTDLSLIDLRGVPSAEYSITLYRENGVIVKVEATR